MRNAFRNGVLKHPHFTYVAGVPVETTLLSGQSEIALRAAVQALNLHQRFYQPLLRTRDVRVKFAWDAAR